MLMVCNVHTFSVLPPPPICLESRFNLEYFSLLKPYFIDFIKEASSISCVNLFVLISGYFGIKWKLKGVISLVFQVYFWIFLIWMICITLGITQFSIVGLYSYSIGLFSAYWFIPAYIGLYLFAPVLNAFAQKSTNRDIIKWISFFLLFQFFDSFPYTQRFTGAGYSVISFCGLYMIGIWLRTGCFSRVKIFDSRLKLIFWICVVTMLVATLTLFVWIFSQKDNGGDLQFLPLSPLAYNNPLVIFQSVLIFSLFMTFNFKSRIINWCAVSSLAIYLLHMHPCLKHIYYGYSRELYELDVISHYTQVILLIIAMVLVAIPIDKIRIMLFDRVYKKIFGNK